MGNRAVIATSLDDVGIYLHWNGGVESVLAFLEVAKILGHRCPTTDSSYGMARLTQVIATFFEGSSSIGIGIANTLDYSDNGVYILGANWTIERRLFSDDRTLTYDGLDTRQQEMFNAIRLSLLDSLEYR